MAKKVRSEKNPNAKKPIYKKWWFWVVIVLVIGAFGGGGNDKKKDETTKSSIEETSVASSTESSESVAESSTKAVESSSTTIESTTESSKADSKWKDTNDQIAEHVKDNQGWALGTIDRDGNPTENGEPDPEYANWVYVQSITVDDSGAVMNVTADFQGLSEAEKNNLASAAQGIVSAYGGEPRTFLEVRNGENVYGSSKILDKTEFSWN